MSQRPRYEPTISLGNLITIVALIVGVAVSWAKVEYHISDGQIHQTVEQKQAAFDNRFALSIQPIAQHVDHIQRQLDELQVRTTSQLDQILATSTGNRVVLDRLVDQRKKDIAKTQPKPDPDKW